MKISELTEVQKQHLAFRLDNNTSMGYIGACKVARMELGNDGVAMFKQYMHVERFGNDEVQKNAKN